MTLNKQTTRREHTVSKTYFRPFTFSQQRIHAFDKETGRRNTPSIRSITVRDFFYDLPPDCLPPGIQDEQIVENALSSLEDVFARERDALLVKVETDGLTDYDCQGFGLYMIVQAMRSQGARRRAQHLKQNHARLVEIDGYTGPMPDAYALDVFTEETAPIVQSQMLLQWWQIYELSEQLHGHIWYVAISEAEEFLTSDEPVRLLRPSGVSLLGEPTPDAAQRVLTGKLHALWPLSPRYLPVVRDRTTGWRDKEFHLKTKRLLPATVMKYNAQQIIGAERYVYSRSGDFRLAEAIRRQYPEFCEPNRNPFYLSMPGATKRPKSPS